MSEPGPAEYAVQSQSANVDLIIHRPRELATRLHSSSRQERISICKDIFNYVYDNCQKYTYSRVVKGFPLERQYYPLKLELSQVDTIVDRITLYDREACMLALAGETNEEKEKTLLGMWVDRVSFADAMYTIRYLLVDRRLSFNQRSGLEKAGKILLGIDSSSKDIPFFKAAHDFYLKYSLDNFEYLKMELPQDLVTIQEVLTKVPEEGAIVELGSGSGRITNSLAQITQENVVGIEILPDYARTAKTRDETQRVNYLIADIKNTGLADNSAKLVISLGRTLMAMDRVELGGVAGEVKRLGGRMLFSYGDPDSPKYREDKLYYLHILKNLGVVKPQSLKDERFIKAHDVIISSSDGINWSDRYVYPNEVLADIFSKAGLQLSIIKHVPIPGLDGALSYYYYVEPKPESLGG